MSQSDLKDNLVHNEKNSNARRFDLKMEIVFKNLSQEIYFKNLNFIQEMLLKVRNLTKNRNFTQIKQILYKN